MPAIIKFLKSIQEAQKQAEVKTKVVDDVKKIHEAFETKDAAKLNDLFNSR